MLAFERADGEMTSGENTESVSDSVPETGWVERTGFWIRGEGVLASACDSG